MPPQDSTVGNWLSDSLAFLKPRLQGCVPRVALTLGSGLGSFPLEVLENAVSFDYGEIPHFPVSRVAGHAGKLWFGKVGEIWVLVMQGRAHFYESWSMQEIMHPVRTMVRLGAEVYIATNAAGSLNLSYPAGSLMVLRSFINNMGENPLLGLNPEDEDGRPLGPRFPDMSEACTPVLIDHVQACANHLGQQVPRGVYLAMSGPTYETPPETMMLQGMHADAAGMSTVPELAAAHHMGARTIGISCMTNLAGGISPVPLKHDHVAEVAGEASKRFVPLMNRVISTMPLSEEN